MPCCALLWLRLRLRQRRVVEMRSCCSPPAAAALTPVPVPTTLPILQIATWKSVVLGSLALGALGIAAANADGLAGLWGGYTDPASWAALGWAGLGPGALASYLHVTVRFAEPVGWLPLGGSASCQQCAACACKLHSGQPRQRRSAASWAGLPG